MVVHKRREGYLSNWQLCQEFSMGSGYKAPFWKMTEEEGMVTCKRCLAKMMSEQINNGKH